MTINIDKVYRTVLAILNKEQRGSMSPDEFNNIAKQAQLSIIEKTIHDYNEALNMRMAGMTNADRANTPDFIREKLDHITKSSSITFSNGVATLPVDSYWIVDISANDRSVRYEELSKQEIVDIKASPLATPMASLPVFYRGDMGDTVNVLPNVSPLNSAEVIVDYIKYPDDPRWGYFENENFGNFEYDPNTYNADSIVIVDDLWTSFFQNITNGIDGTYTAEASLPVGGNITVTAVISGGVVTSVTPTETTSDVSVGDTLTISTIVSTLNNTDLPVSAPSNDLLILLTEEDFYAGSTGGSTDFTLHPSQDVDLVLEILAFAGVVINRPEITQMVSQLMTANEIQKQ